MSCRVEGIMCDESAQNHTYTNMLLSIKFEKSLSTYTREEKCEGEGTACRGYEDFHKLMDGPNSI